jgi:hypothetical protein
VLMFPRNGSNMSFLISALVTGAFLLAYALLTSQCVEMSVGSRKCNHDTKPLLETFADS